MDEDRIDEDREEVTDEIERDPETADEASEQRTDDYQGLARRLDDLLDMVRARFDRLDEAIGAVQVAAVDSGIDAADIADAAAEAVDEILTLDALDLL